MTVVYVSVVHKVYTDNATKGLIALSNTGCTCSCIVKIHVLLCSIHPLSS